MNYFEFAIILYNIKIILSKHNVTYNFVFIGLHLKKMDFLIVSYIYNKNDKNNYVFHRAYFFAEII